MEASTEREKKIAASEALKLVKDGMVVGLGTGSTVKYFLEGLSILVEKGYRIVGVPTSRDTATRARNLGITVDEDFVGDIDLDVDGADEIDQAGNLIKGGGGALLREKVVARNSRRVCIVADRSKWKESGLGDFGVPIEIFPFMHLNTKRIVEKIGAKCTVRENGSFKTDNGNFILDCNFGKIMDPKGLELKIKHVPGVAEVGIFTSLCDVVILGTQKGPQKIEMKRN